VDQRVAFSDWPDVKRTTPFGKVPVLSVDGGPPRAQSGAMLRWIGTDLAPELYPKDKLYDVEEALGLLDDFDRAREPAIVINMFPEWYGYAPGWNKTEEGQATVKALRAKLVGEILPEYAAHLEQMLAKYGPEGWLASPSDSGPTLADCVAVPILRYLTLGVADHVPADCLDKYPALVDYVKRFCSLPQVAGRYSKGLR
jgi:glutathione S-transferase